MSVVNSRLIILTIFGIFCFGAGWYVGSVNLFSISPNTLDIKEIQGFGLYQTCMSLAGVFDAFIPHSAELEQEKTSELEQKTNSKMPEIFTMKSMSKYCDEYKK
ncbi:MAG: hypothetical protein WD154_02800 [Nitrosopumilaceae archaeon]